MKKTFIQLCLGCVLLYACQSASNEPNDKTQDPVVAAMKIQIASYPDSTALVDKLIDTLTNRGNIDGAAAWCDSLLIRDSINHFIYLLVKADLYRGAAKFSQAIAAYKNYLAQKPEEPMVFLTLANTMAEAGDPQTMEVCEDIWQRFPTPQTRVGLHYIRGVYHNSKKEYATARQWLDSTIKYDYFFADAYLEKGYSWYDEGNFTAAAKTFRQLTEVSPKRADAWYWLGKSYDTLHQTTEAIGAYERALLYQSNFSEAQEAIARLKQKIPAE